MPRKRQPASPIRYFNAPPQAIHVVAKVYPN
jgi:hypothetical protein